MGADSYCLFNYKISFFPEIIFSRLMLSDLRFTISSSQLVAEEVWTDSPGRAKSMDKE